MNITLSGLDYVELMFLVIASSLLLVALFYLKSLKRKAEFKAIALILTFLVFEVLGKFIPSGPTKHILYDVTSRALLLVALFLLLVKDREFFSQQKGEFI